jgi:formylglycine-generating enzyme required for sulfatase activity
MTAFWLAACGRIPETSSKPVAKESPAVPQQVEESDAPATPAAPWKDGAQAGQERNDNSLQLKLAWCPAGKFRMGSPPDEKDRRPQEGPVDVTLTHGFWIGKHELTQKEWETVMQTKPCHGPLKKYVKEGETFPVSYVTWDDATEFCRKLTRTEHRAGRLPMDWEYSLPTEAQWEYACRAGTSTRFSCGNDEKELPDYAWFGIKIVKERIDAKDKSEPYAHEVGQKKPNAWGLFDMHGNVMEWCRDAAVDKLPGGNDPLVKNGNDFREARGGNWTFKAKVCRSASRYGNLPQTADYAVGFRIAAMPKGK